MFGLFQEDIPFIGNPKDLMQMLEPSEALKLSTEVVEAKETTKKKFVIKEEKILRFFILYFLYLSQLLLH